MYRTGRRRLCGLAKNATEGLATPVMIVPATAVLLGGQVLPVALVAAAAWLPPSIAYLALIAAAASYYPRFAAAWRFRQSWLVACLHPAAILIFLAIQWHALLRRPAPPGDLEGTRISSPPSISHPGSAKGVRTLLDVQKGVRTLLWTRPLTLSRRGGRRSRSIVRKPRMSRSNRADTRFPAIGCGFVPSLSEAVGRFCYDQARSKRSRFITLFQAATKSWTNFFSASELP